MKRLFQKKYLLDTNILVRFIVGDNEQQLKKIHSTFTEAEEGKVLCYLHDIVIIECCHVLQTIYHLKPSEIAENLTELLFFPWIRFSDKERVFQILELYAQGVHLADAYLLVLSEEYECDIFSFDKKLLNMRKK